MHIDVFIPKKELEVKYKNYDTIHSNLEKDKIISDFDQTPSNQFSETDSSKLQVKLPSTIRQEQTWLNLPVDANDQANYGQSSTQDEIKTNDKLYDTYDIHNYFWDRVPQKVNRVSVSYPLLETIYPRINTMKQLSEYRLNLPTATTTKDVEVIKQVITVTKVVSPNDRVLVPFTKTLYMTPKVITTIFKTTDMFSIPKIAVFLSTSSLFFTLPKVISASVPQEPLTSVVTSARLGLPAVTEEPLPPLTKLTTSEATSVIVIPLGRQYQTTTNATTSIVSTLLSSLKSHVSQESSKVTPTIVVANSEIKTTPNQNSISEAKNLQPSDNQVSPQTITPTSKYNNGPKRNGSKAMNTSSLNNSSDTVQPSYFLLQMAPNADHPKGFNIILEPFPNTTLTYTDSFILNLHRKRN